MDTNIQAALGSFDIGFGEMSPDEDIIRTGRVPVDSYVSKEFFDRETEIFKHVWLNIGVDSEIAKPGDWIVRGIEVASVSILVVRGADHQIRAFHNVCSHRSLKVVWGEQGCNKQFVCPYHAWTYGMDGRLRGVPDRQAFPDLDQEASGLTPINIEVWK